MKSLNRFIPLATAALITCQAAYALTAENWLNLRQNPSVLTLQREGIAKRAPDSTATLTTATLSSLPAGNGVRLRGTVTPSVSGLYSFAISGSNNATLWLSTDGSRFNKQSIAWFHEPTSVQQWNKFAKQQSAPIQLEAGTAYYIEAHVMSSTTGGHFALGWKTPGATAYAVVPSAQLAAVQPDPLDINNNNLPDTFEVQYGLDQSTILGALSEYGDPDNDGMTNFEEYRLGANPLLKESRPDGLTLDTWQELQGTSVSGLTGARSRFLSHPNATSHVAGIDVNNANKIEGANYGARYRGFLIAPTTGTYHLWVAGDDSAELWFSDGTVTDPTTGAPLTNRFGKQLLASCSNLGGAHRDYDMNPIQKTRELQLTEGQAYYVEVLHKNESISGNHVSIAWAGPGFSRTVIPASAFNGDIPEDTDADGDALPDSYETTVSLSPADNGIINSKEGQYGDFDADGLNNLLEFQLRTNPKVADTDGDGLTDSAEVNYYRTNPLIANVIATTTVANLNLGAHSATSVPWETLTDGSIRAYERRGWTEWTFTIAQGNEGIHEIHLRGGGAANFSVPLSLHLNGELIAHQTLAASSTQNSTIKQLTPWLHAGTHTLRIQSHNSRTTNKLVLRSISILRLGGTDANSNGIADWVEIQFNEENKLTRLPTESLTSPAFIEGTASSLNALAISRSVSGGEAVTQEIKPGVNKGFYANVPLNAEAPTDLTVSFQGGASIASHSVAWTATNIFEHSSLTIRKGDSLRLTAHNSGTNPSGTFTLLGSVDAPLVPANAIASVQSTAVTFDTAGTHTYTATWTPEEGEPQTATLTVNVRSADFGPAYILQTYNRRTWSVTGVNGMDIEADSALYWQETTAAGATSRSFLANAYTAGEFTTIARVPETGEIIASGTVSAFSLTRTTAVGDAQTVLIRPDGSKVIRFSIVGENLPPNVEVRIFMKYQGTVFPDGSRTLVLRSSDFSSNGIANVLVETSSDPPQLCHTMHAVLID
jgi:hypothetical protein